MAQHNTLGSSGETLARDYLVAENYIIRHVNWRYRNLELDIVAEKDNLLIIVEVKTRSTNYFHNPQDAVNSRKIKHLVNAANEYIRLFDWQGETRFDVISIISDGTSNRIQHIEDAFLPPLNY